MKESRTLTIEGDLVRVQRTTIEKEVSATQFLEEIAKTQPLETGPLPMDCVAYYRWQVRDTGEPVTVYLLEQAPGPQKVKYRSAGDENHERGEILDLVLSWPRTLWFVECMGGALKDVYITAIDTPFSEQAQATPLRRLLMPNQYDGTGSLCMGDLTISSSASMAQRIDQLVKQIEESVWNTDLMPNFAETGIDGVEDWAKETARDPDFHRQIEFPTHWARTVADLLRRLRGEERQ